MNPLFVVGDTPTITTCFLTPDEQRQRILMLIGLKRMKFTHDKAAGARENDRNRWLQGGDCCNEAKQNQKHKEVACKSHCELNHFQTRSCQTTF